MATVREAASETCKWAGKLLVQQNMAVAVCSTGKGSTEVCGGYFREDPTEHSHSDSCEGARQICCPWHCHSISCGIWVSMLQVNVEPTLLPSLCFPFPPIRYSNIFVTSPSPENLRTLFDFVFRGFDALKYSEHEDYEVVQSTNPEFNKAVVRVNIFREHRQTIQVCMGEPSSPSFPTLTLPPLLPFPPSPFSPTPLPPSSLLTLSHSQSPPFPVHPP